MYPAQVPELIARIALADPRVRREDPVEQTAQIDMWAGILADVPYDYAMQAAHAHYSKSTWPILPADIANRWMTDVRDRLDRHASFEPNHHPELDPDAETGDAFVAALKAERHAVATGQQPPNEVRAIMAGPADPAVQARLDAEGTYMPPSVKETLAALRPEAVERERLIRSGLADPRSVTCPWDACRAPQGQRCRTNGRDRREYHPARISAATAALQDVA
ncbi:hypothetical protein EAO70_04890 [Streptomyces sp. adm13(2018)]|uniref:zinc finger domain-containing protein n=1 Tax=Streptomyces sp. adm13(2018) TaxID=2479007 RepID=UPI0011CE931B|nr:hypothetical protein [Streptomyces sp. adm13(2018)]TXS23109.1 hypothetical protein EAO70_04890 [Streptomyces sp. adm13(2018)]